jgi:ADP-heptose:LPS heptosyltransferase
LIRLRLIGDVAFTTPAVAAVRRRYPGARISYLVEGAAAAVMRNNPHVDDLIVAARPRGWRRLRSDVALARRLRAARFDVVIDFHGGPRSAWLTWATRAPVRIGYDLPGRRFAYTARFPWSRSLVPPRHSVLNQWDLLTQLASPGEAWAGAPDPKANPVEIPVDQTAAAEVDRRLREAGLAAGHAIVVIHVSAGNPFRRWPAESFVALAAARAAGPERRIVFTSGPAEAGAAERVADQARARAGPRAARIVRCGEFDIPELRALVERAALYVGGDSGPLHVASASRTPIVALFGPTLPDRSVPWRDPAIPTVAVDAGPLPCRPCHQRHCVPGDFRCLTSITPEQVLSACEVALRGGR